ncbi:MAG: hypothetical protein RLY47_452 [Candidatus Parcubacteria bacterium]|jgi:hypothetical protein
MTPKRFILLIVIVVVLIAGGGAYYFWSHETFDRSAMTTTTGEEPTDDDVASILQAVSKHIILPEGEEPVVAKIINVDELLKTQQFYRGAINGDILLIYQATSKAILYSPSRDMLVNVGPIIADEEADTTPVEAEVSEETTEGAQ